MYLVPVTRRPARVFDRFFDEAFDHLFANTNASADTPKSNARTPALERHRDR